MEMTEVQPTLEEREEFTHMAEKQMNRYKRQANTSRKLALNDTLKGRINHHLTPLRNKTQKTVKTNT